MCKPGSLKTSTITTFALICLQAVISLPCKNLQVNIISEGFIGMIVQQSKHYALLDVPVVRLTAHHKE